MYLNRDRLNKLRKTKDVRVEDWDCEVHIKQMSIQQQLDIEAANKEKADGSEVIYLTLLYCCMDDDGNPLFGNKDDIKNLPSNGVVELFKHCLELNGIGEHELDKRAKN